MINRLPRMFDWLLITLVLLGLIAVLSPQQLPVSLYKLSLITMAAVVGYWIDRSLFPYARPDGYLSLDTKQPWPEVVTLGRNRIGEADLPIASRHELVFAIAMLRRAIIVGCAMLAVSLGL